MTLIATIARLQLPLEVAGQARRCLELRLIIIQLVDRSAGKDSSLGLGLQNLGHPARQKDSARDFLHETNPLEANQLFESLHLSCNLHCDHLDAI